MKKIVFLVMVLVAFSARAGEDYSQYYFTGLYSVEKNKHYEGSVETKHFHIYDNKGYLDVEFESRTLDQIPDGNHKSITNQGTQISFNIKKGVVSNLKILSKNIKEKKEKPGGMCGDAAFFYEYLSANKLENFKKKEGNIFLKYNIYQEVYEQSKMPVLTLLILKNSKEKKLQSIGIYGDGFPYSLTGNLKFKLQLLPEENIFSPDKYAIVMMEKSDKSEKYLEINNCLVTYYKNPQNKFSTKE